MCAHLEHLLVFPLHSGVGGSRQTWGGVRGHGTDSLLVTACSTVSLRAGRRGTEGDGPVGCVFRISFLAS